MCGRIESFIGHFFLSWICSSSDHDATGEAVAEALATIPENKRPTFYAVAFANNHEAEIGPPHVKNEVKEYVPKVGSIASTCITICD